MNCGDIDFNQHLEKRDFIKEAGDMIGINLKEPIDLSQMQVHNVSSEPFRDEQGCFYIKRSTNLFIHTINEHGEREELKITFELKSQRQPKRDKDETLDEQEARKRTRKE